MRVQYRVCWTYNADEEPKYLWMAMCELRHAKRLYEAGDMDDLDEYLSDMKEQEMDVYISSDNINDELRFTPIPDIDSL